MLKLSYTPIILHNYGIWKLINTEKNSNSYYLYEWESCQLSSSRLVEDLWAKLQQNSRKWLILDLKPISCKLICSIFLRFLNLNLDFQHFIMSYFKTSSCFWPLLSGFQINIVGEPIFLPLLLKLWFIWSATQNLHCKNVDGSHLNNITFSGLWAQRTIGRSSQAKSGAWLDIRGGGIKGKVTRSLTPHMLASHPH